MLSFFPRGVLDEILNLIESVSEGFLSYYWWLLFLLSFLKAYHAHFDLYTFFQTSSVENFEILPFHLNCHYLLNFIFLSERFSGEQKFSSERTCLRKDRFGLAET